MQKLSVEQALAQVAGLPGWHLDTQRGAISREYVFEDFMQAFAFMTHLALAAEKRNHHPEWSNVYNRVRVTWTTHDVGGLSLNDIAMARLCDHAAG